MTFRIHIEPRSNYLHAVVTGPNTRDNVARYLAAVQAECAARNCFRVLVEERLEGPRLPLKDVRELVMGARERFAPGRFPMVAYVDVNAERPPMPLDTARAESHGPDVWTFPTVVEAERWLAELEPLHGG